MRPEESVLHRGCHEPQGRIEQEIPEPWMSHEAPIVVEHDVATPLFEAQKLLEMLALLMEVSSSIWKQLGKRFRDVAGSGFRHGLARSVLDLWRIHARIFTPRAVRGRRA